MKRKYHPLIGTGLFRTLVFLLVSVVIVFPVPAQEPGPGLSEEDVILFLSILPTGGPLTGVQVGGPTLVPGTSWVSIQGGTYGDAASYDWIQVSGPAVVLNKNYASLLQFSAPDVVEASQLVFRFTATDALGNVFSDDLVVNVSPGELPDSVVDFPCDGCRSYGTAISVRGRVAARENSAFVENNHIDEVSVSLHAGDSLTTLHPVTDVSGGWFIEDIPVPEDINSYTLEITATDSLGLMSVDTLYLEHVPTFITPRMAADPVQEDILYFLEDNRVDRVVKYDITDHSRSVLYEYYGYDGIGQTLDMVVDPDGSRLIYGEFSTGVMSAIDLSTGTVSTISGNGTGSGPEIQFATTFALDTDDDRLAVFDSKEHALFLVDLTTGNRSVVVDHEDGGVLDAGSSGRLTLDSTNNIAYLYTDALYRISLDTEDDVDYLGHLSPSPSSFVYNPDENQLGYVWFITDQVYIKDLDTFTETILSDEGANGVVIGNQIIKDPFSNRFLVSNLNKNTHLNDTTSVIAVDAVTGERELIFSDTIGEGPLVIGTNSIELSSDGEKLYLLSFQEANLIEISPATHNRTLIADDVTGAGPDMDAPSDIVLFDDTHALIADAGLGAILKINLQTGDRSVISGLGTGDGTDLLEPRSMALDIDQGVVYVLDTDFEPETDNSAIYRIDLETGDRAVLSDNGNSGHPMLEPTAIALDAAHSRLLLCENGTGSTTSIKLVGVDLETGNRPLAVSSSVKGQGTDFNGLTDVLIRSDDGYAVVSADEGFMRVDLDTGDRTVITSRTTNNGDIMVNHHRMVIDEESNIIYTYILDLNALVAIDYVSGDRVIVSR